MKTKILLIFLCLVWLGLTKAVLSQTTLTITASQPEVLLAYAGSDVTLKKGQTFTLGGIIAATGGTGTYTYTWSPANGLSSPSTSAPILTASVNTSYTLMVTDAAGCIASDEIKITVGGASATSNIEANDISVSPNPATDIAIVELSASGNAYQLTLFNFDGKHIWSGWAQSFNNPVKQEVSLNSVASGLYILYIRNGDKTWTRKIVKQ
jgi:hypothetical protein